MLTRNINLQNPTTKANAPIPVTVKRLGSHAVTVMATGKAMTTVDGKVQYFHNLDEAEEFLSLYDQGNQDRAVCFARPGFGLVIKGSLVRRADQWVKDEAHDLEISDLNYVWWFTFSSVDGTDRVMAQTYDEAMTELGYLIQRETDAELESCF